MPKYTEVCRLDISGDKWWGVVHEINDTSPELTVKMFILRLKQFHPLPKYVTLEYAKSCNVVMMACEMTDDAAAFRQYFLSLTPELFERAWDKHCAGNVLITPAKPAIEINNVVKDKDGRFGTLGGNMLKLIDEKFRCPDCGLIGLHNCVGKKARGHWVEEESTNQQIKFMKNAIMDNFKQELLHYPSAPVGIDSKGNLMGVNDFGTFIKLSVPKKQDSDVHLMNENVEYRTMAADYDAIHSRQTIIREIRTREYMIGPNHDGWGKPIDAKAIIKQLQDKDKPQGITQHERSLERENLELRKILSLVMGDKPLQIPLHELEEIDPVQLNDGVGPNQLTHTVLVKQPKLPTTNGVHYVEIEGRPDQIIHRLNIVAANTDGKFTREFVHGFINAMASAVDCKGLPRYDVRQVQQVASWFANGKYSDDDRCERANKQYPEIRYCVTDRYIGKSWRTWLRYDEVDSLKGNQFGSVPNDYADKTHSPSTKALYDRLRTNKNAEGSSELRKERVDESRPTDGCKQDTGSSKEGTVCKDG